MRSSFCTHLAGSLCALMAATQPAAAQGRLHAFEADTSAQESRGRDHRDRSDRCFSSFWGEFFAEVFEATLGCGGACSWDRVTRRDAAGAGIVPRTLGDPLIPFARADVACQRIESDIDAVDVRAEVGYGPMGMHLDSTRYWERSPSDDLDITRVMGLYRMSFGSHVEIDLGLGVLSLKGDRTTSRSLFSVPFLFHPCEWWGIEFRPAWADRVSDRDVAVLLTRRHVSLKVGYRWVDSPRESLDGPYAGVSIRR
jgi:hypothetical protein